MTAKQVERLFAILAEHIVPKAELDWETPLDLLVAVVLSAQRTANAVNRITASLRQECRTPEEYLELGEEGLQERIRTIGLFRNKAKSIIGLCERLAAEHGGSVPRTREALQALPGVGRKTANVVLNVAFGEPVIAVDTHIFRVANRVGLTCEKTPEKAQGNERCRDPWGSPHGVLPPWRRALHCNHRLRAVDAMHLPAAAPGHRAADR